MHLKKLILQTIIAASFIGLITATTWYVTSDTAQLHRILPLKDNHILQAFFSPDDDIENILVHLINAEQSDIKIAAYLLTNAAVTEALLDAVNRGISLEFIGDMKDSYRGYGRIGLLYDAHIPIWIFPHTNKGIMHNKFMIFKNNVYGRALLCTGSFNYTWSAAKKNQENIIIVDDESIIATYEQHFEKLKARCKKLSASYEFPFLERNCASASSKSRGKGASKE